MGFLYSYQTERGGFFVKLAHVFLLTIYALNCQIVAAGDSTESDRAAQSLHSQIKHVESEIMRVWITIDALVDEISHNSDALTEDMHKNLANLYYYDCELDVYLGELQNELIRLDDPSRTVFTKSQFKPIKSSIRMYGMPAESLSILNGSKIAIK
jgi:hypothetical protein